MVGSVGNLVRDDHGVWVPVGIGRNRRQVELGRELAPLALADVRGLLRVSVHAQTRAVQISVGVAACLTWDRESSAISRRSVSYRSAAMRWASARVAYRRNVCRLDRTAAITLIVPTANRIASESMPPVVIESDRVFCIEAKALVPTRVVSTTTGIPDQQVPAPQAVRHEAMAVFGRRDATMPRLVEMLDLVVPGRTRGRPGFGGCGAACSSFGHDVLRWISGLTGRQRRSPGQSAKLVIPGSPSGPTPFLPTDARFPWHDAQGCGGSPPSFTARRGGADGETVLDPSHAEPEGTPFPRAPGVHREAVPPAAHRLPDRLLRARGRSST